MISSSLFVLSVVVLSYTFFGYPIILFILSIFIKKRVVRADIEPRVTLIIPVYNEASNIRAKIENCLQFDYPGDKLSIIVASDASTDRTEEIVRGYASDQVRLLSLPFRGGKGVVQNHAVQYCDAEVVIFTDVAILTKPDCVRQIVQNFNDDTIGVVSCRDFIIAGEHQPKGEKNYIKYDMMVRKYTSQIASLIGVTGGFYAVRSEIAKGGWNPAFPPDFYVAIRCIKRGLRAVEDPRVGAYYKVAAKQWDELNRKVRTLNRGMSALFSVSNRELLNPFKYGIVSLELISHKLLRWMVPFFLILLFFSNMMLLAHSALAFLTFIPQVCLYFMSVLAFLNRKRPYKKKYLKYFIFFAIANVAIVVAWYEYLTGKRYVRWMPTKR